MLVVVVVPLNGVFCRREVISSYLFRVSRVQNISSEQNAFCSSDASGG